MSPAEVKAKDKKGALQSGLKVLANILTLGKSDDPNQDITKSSSLPTLLIQLLKNLLKSVDAPLAKTSSLPDLLTDLVRAIALLGKSSFNRQLGIEPIVLKVFIPLIPLMIKGESGTHPQLQMAAIKALGVFASQASIIPIRMQNFYKEVVEQKIVHDLIALIGAVTGSGGPIHKAALHVISVLMNPFFGDTYSYPWKRGPHDNLPEYLEALPTFDNLLR